MEEHDFIESLPSHLKIIHSDNKEMHISNIKYPGIIISVAVYKDINSEDNSLSIDSYLLDNNISSSADKLNNRNTPKFPTYKEIENRFYEISQAIGNDSNHSTYNNMNFNYAPLPRLNPTNNKNLPNDLYTSPDDEIFNRKYSTYNKYNPSIDGDNTNIFTHEYTLNTHDTKNKKDNKYIYAPPNARIYPMCPDTTSNINKGKMKTTEPDPDTDLKCLLDGYNGDDDDDFKSNFL
ncbi:hypothetical protein CDIK_2101 [Cucumispora dikerogammari]|nr:hypothetical protein CDIK_2101 [Cucumispora dikerogammari]